MNEALDILYKIEQIIFRGIVIDFKYRNNFMIQMLELPNIKLIKIYNKLVESEKKIIFELINAKTKILKEENDILRKYV